MGGDYYGGREVGTSSGGGYSEASSEAVGGTTEMHSSMNPKRWAEENLTCENLDPIIFALDVTGSMGNWTRIIYDKMPMFYGQIMMQKYLKDPAISFCAIGDVTCSKAPLQVTEFGQGKSIDQLISKMFLEGGGGSTDEESYDLAAYFYATHVDLIYPEFPFFFVTGDERFYETITNQQIQKVFGIGLKDKEVNSREMWNKLKEKYNVFLIKKPYSHNDSKVLKQWNEAIGPERVLKIVTPKACIDVMLGAIAITSGARDLKGYIQDMKTRGQTEERIDEVTHALKLYSEKFEKNEINVIKYKANQIILDRLNEENGSPNKDTETSSTIPGKKISEKDSHNIQQQVEKHFAEQLDQDSLQFRLKLLKLNSEKSESIPKEFICPILEKIIFDPVMTSDGHTFERKAIEIWFEENETSPITGLAVDTKALLPNFALKQLINDFVSSN